MRLRIALLVAFTLGVSFTMEGSTSQDKGTKTEKKKKETKQSLVEKYDEKSVKSFKDFLFHDNKVMKFNGKKEAEEDVKLLNDIEKLLISSAKLKALLDKEKVKVPPQHEKAVAAVMEVVKAKANLLKSLKPLLEFRLDEAPSDVGYRIEWSPKGQWIVTEVKRNKK